MQVHDWLLESANTRDFEPVARIMLARQAHTMLKKRVGGEILCYASPQVIADLLHVPSATGGVGGNPLFGGPEGDGGEASQLPSTRHVCMPAALAQVRNASLLWAGGRPDSSLDALKAAVTADERCCAPYREFSRHFLGGNSPYLNLEAASQRAAVRERVLFEWLDRSSVDIYGDDNGNAQWREVAGYAAAHVLFFGDASSGTEGQQTKEGEGAGLMRHGTEPSDPEAARAVVAELVAPPPADRRSDAPARSYPQSLMNGTPS